MESNPDTCTEHTKYNYKSKMNMSCYFDEEIIERQTILQLFLFSILLLCCIWAWRKTQVKKRMVTQEKVNCQYDETYCVLTRQVFQVNLVLIVFVSIIYALMIVEIAAGDSYADLFLSKAYFECNKQRSIKNSSIYKFIKEFITTSRDTMRQFVNLM